MSIIVKKTDNGTEVFVNEYRIAIITTETPSHAVNRFIHLCKQEERMLDTIFTEVEIRRNWNYSHLGSGKNWPVFKTAEKMVNRLCNEAGIIDS